MLFKHIVLGIPYTHLTLASLVTSNLLTVFVASLVALSTSEGAYMAEIVRAGIHSVGTGQREAALALGMTKSQVMRRVVLPQALRVIVPPTGNESISMLKNTSLVSVIAGGDLLTRAQDISDHPPSGRTPQVGGIHASGVRGEPAAPATTRSLPEAVQEGRVRARDRPAPKRRRGRP